MRLWLKGAYPLALLALRQAHLSTLYGGVTGWLSLS